MRTKTMEFFKVRIRSSGTIGPMFPLTVTRLEGHSASPLVRWGFGSHYSSHSSVSHLLYPSGSWWAPVPGLVLCPRTSTRSWDKNQFLPRLLGEAGWRTGLCRAVGPNPCIGEDTAPWVGAQGSSLVPGLEDWSLSIKTWELDGLESVLFRQTLGPNSGIASDWNNIGQDSIISVPCLQNMKFHI